MMNQRKQMVSSWPGQWACLTQMTVFSYTLSILHRGTLTVLVPVSRVDDPEYIVCCPSHTWLLHINGPYAAAFP